MFAFGPAERVWPAKRVSPANTLFTSKGPSDQQNDFPPANALITSKTTSHQQTRSRNAPGHIATGVGDCETFLDMCCYAYDYDGTELFSVPDSLKFTVSCNSNTVALSCGPPSWTLGATYISGAHSAIREPGYQGVGIHQGGPGDG